jgi:uncharacterized membrane protein YphA (DoxX/SURF4 family)
MKAVRSHARGDPEGLVYEDAPLPVPGPGEVRVRVCAAGITPTELSWPTTYQTADGHERFPSIPCHDVSGIVEELPPGATGPTLGDAVYGLIAFPRDGSAAEYVTVRAADLPPPLIPLAAWASTALELLLALTLLVGLGTRCSAALTGLLLLAYTAAMALSFGPKEPLAYSVPTAAAGAFLLALLPQSAHVLSLDRLPRFRRRGEGWSSLVRGLTGAGVGAGLLLLGVIGVGLVVRAVVRVSW